MASMHGRQQQTAIPIRHATATQMSTIMTSKERNVIQSLHNTNMNSDYKIWQGRILHKENNLTNKYCSKFQLTSKAEVNPLSNSGHQQLPSRTQQSTI